MSNRKQPQRLPPPITQGDEPFEGAVILEEFSDLTGALLWKTARSVRLWADVGESDRPRAFSEGAYAERRMLLAEACLPEDIREALETAAGVLKPRARGRKVAKACVDVAEWAAEAGKLGTSIELLQAAAFAARSDASLAHQVARTARTAGQYHRAETWYRQAISRARRARSWNDFARSYIGLGTVYTLRGSYPQAARALLRGLRAARRHSIRPLVAAAAHELVIVGIRTNRPVEVSRFGRLAVEAYGIHHPRLPALSHDLGIYLLNAGYFEASFRIIHATPPTYGAPVDQLVRWSALVRVAGALGKREVYQEALARAEALLDDPATGVGATEARLAIAAGADLMGDRERALREAQMVSDIAAQRGEAQLVFAAESLIESIQMGEIARLNAAAQAARSETPHPLAGLVQELESALGADQAA